MKEWWLVASPGLAALALVAAAGLRSELCRQLGLAWIVCTYLVLIIAAGSRQADTLAVVGSALASILLIAYAYLAADAWLETQEPVARTAAAAARAQHKLVAEWLDSPQEFHFARKSAAQVFAPLAQVERVA